jgi:hypothetical protein
VPPVVLESVIACPFVARIGARLGVQRGAVDEFLDAAVERSAFDQLAVTDLIVNGVLERHERLRIGIVELSAVWVPLYLMMLDGAWDFTSRLNGRTLAPLSLRPSEYLARQVRVAAFSYEQPARLAARSSDIYMACSDFPHSEGTADPLAGYRAGGCDVERDTALFHDNVELLLGIGR